ncbi:GNAT family N-acetyltransferase [Flavobacteriaceae bacterium Ap0902]|nr:GNAT family N-acetyltransferase [Flavobacteriaceae bacterium Ap0902]
MEIKHNRAEKQFEYTEGDQTGYLKYSIYRQKNLAITHTKVPESMKGKGIGSALAKHAFDYAKEHNKMVMVYCPFVSKFLKKNPQFRNQLNPEYHPSSTMRKKK